jgi:hypothetical protein
MSRYRRRPSVPPFAVDQRGWPLFKRPFEALTLELPAVQFIGHMWVKPRARDAERVYRARDAELEQDTGEFALIGAAQ